MNLVDTFPLMFCLNLARRQDRRMVCEEEFEMVGLLDAVERFPAVDAKWVKPRRMRGYQNPGKYAHTLGLRMMLRRARMEGAPAVFIFEDDVVFHSNLHEELKKIELPDDWGMFYLGGMHFERPEAVKQQRGLVQARGMVSTHAFGVRAAYFDRIIESLNKSGPLDEGIIPGADMILARLHEEIPTYAVYPNLAGQREGHSDLAGGSYQPFTSDGQQIWLAECMAGLAAEAQGGSAYPPAKSHAERLRAWFRYGPAPTNYNHKLVDENGKEVADVPNENAETTAKICLKSEVRSPNEITVAFLFQGKCLYDSDWSSYCHDPSLLIELDSGGENEDQLSLVGRRNGLRSALKNTEVDFVFLLPATCVPIRPLEDLLQLLAIDGRCRFNFQSAPELVEQQQVFNVPSNLVVKHSPWILLNREAAELVAEDDFSDLFAASDNRDDWCYEATVLRMKGYPLEQMIACQDLYVPIQKPGDSNSPINDNATHAVGMVFGSGAYFSDRQARTMLDVSTV